MDTQMQDQVDEQTLEQGEIGALYRRLLGSWNMRNAEAFAACFAENASVVGYDGSQMNGRAEIAAELGKIFASHATAAYVAIIREVRYLNPDTALLRSAVGMVPPGKASLNPSVNAIQSMVAVKQSDGWQIALFQNTPAQFHGRPDLAAELAEELSELV